MRYLFLVLALFTAIAVTALLIVHQVQHRASFNKRWQPVLNLLTRPSLPNANIHKSNKLKSPGLSTIWSAVASL